MTSPLARSLTASALTELVQRWAGLPPDMEALVDVRSSFESCCPVARVMLRTHQGESEAFVDLVHEDPRDNAKAVLDALPDAINECWASSLSLTPDEAMPIRERSWALANAVDTDPTPPPPVTTPAQDGCTFCGAEPGEPHRGCVLR